MALEPTGWTSALAGLPVAAGADEGAPVDVADERAQVESGVVVAERPPATLAPITPARAPRRRVELLAVPLGAVVGLAVAVAVSVVLARPAGPPVPPVVERASGPAPEPPAAVSLGPPAAVSLGPPAAVSLGPPVAVSLGPPAAVPLQPFAVTGERADGGAWVSWSADPLPGGTLAYFYGAGGALDDALKGADVPPADVTARRTFVPAHPDHPCVYLVAIDGATLRRSFAFCDFPGRS